MSSPNHTNKSRRTLGFAAQEASVPATARSTDPFLDDSALLPAEDARCSFPARALVAFQAEIDEGLRQIESWSVAQRPRILAFYEESAAITRLGITHESISGCDCFRRAREEAAATASYVVRPWR